MKPELFDTIERLRRAIDVDDNGDFVLARADDILDVIKAAEKAEASIRKEHAKAVMRAVRVLQNTTYAPTKSENTFWAGVDHSITELTNYAAAIVRGEVEI